MFLIFQPNKKKIWICKIYFGFTGNNLLTLFFSISFSKTDVAISAPYGGKDRGGVVFIYFGTKDGIESSFRQVNYFNSVLP